MRLGIWCRDAGLVGQAGKPREQDTTPAISEFRRRFGSDLPAIEKGFKEWLKTL